MVVTIRRKKSILITIPYYTTTTTTTTTMKNSTDIGIGQYSHYHHYRKKKRKLQSSIMIIYYGTFYGLIVAVFLLLLQQHQLQDTIRDPDHLNHHRRRLNQNSDRNNNNNNDSNNNNDDNNDSNNNNNVLQQQQQQQQQQDDKIIQKNNSIVSMMEMYDSIESKCSTDPVWDNDIEWKDAVIHPQLCGSISTTTINNDNDENHHIEQQLLFHETMYNYTHNQFPYCGQYCIYPYQSYYSYIYGQPILGYTLQTSIEDKTKKCWKPFTTYYENNPCGLQHYDEWITIIEPYIQSQQQQSHQQQQRTTTYQCRNHNHSSNTAGIVVRNSSNSKSFVRGRNDDDNNNNNHQNSCNDETIVDTYIQIQRNIQQQCQQQQQIQTSINNNPTNNTTTYILDRIQQWFYYQTNQRSLRIHNHHQQYDNKKQQQQQLLEYKYETPFCNMSLLKHENITTFHPSDIEQLYTKHQLGMYDLAQALVLFNYSNSNSNNTSICDNVIVSENQCIYHHQSIPNVNGKIKVGQYGIHVPIKGWEYNRLYQCIIPIVDMESHITCGRNSQQYNYWANHMMIQQYKITTSQSMQKSLTSTTTTTAAVVTESVTSSPICDKLPLTHGRHYWDYNTNEDIYIPPNSTKNETVCGPRILIVGAMKCGTNTIGTLLSHHPRIKMNLCPDSTLSGCNLQNYQGDYNTYTQSIETIWENHGLSHQYIEDPMNYVGRMTQKLPYITEHDHGVTFDKSPSYLNTDIFPNIAQRTHALLPNAKIIVSVCDPVQRLYSEYNHVWNENEYNGRYYEELFYKNHNVRIPNNFSEFVQDFMYHDPNDKNENYNNDTNNNDTTTTTSTSSSSSITCRNNLQCSTELRRNKLNTGMYVHDIRHWRNYYGNENVIVVHMDRTNEEKMNDIFSIMNDFLPSNEYPWDTIRSKHTTVSSSSLLLNETTTATSTTTTTTTSTSTLKAFRNTKYSGRNSGHLYYKDAFDWLYEYYNESNIELSKEVHDIYPLLWNTQKGG